MVTLLRQLVAATKIIDVNSNVKYQTSAIFDNNELILMTQIIFAIYLRCSWFYNQIQQFSKRGLIQAPNAVAKVSTMENPFVQLLQEVLQTSIYSTIAAGGLFDVAQNAY